MMEIRNANPDDIPTLSRLNVAVQILHAEGQPDFFKIPEDENFAIPFFEMIMANENTNIFILEDEGEALGYIVLRVIRREENPFMYARQQLYIDQITVEPEQQGKGYGAALLKKSMELAEELGLNRVVLDTWHFNTDAHQFFEKQGFETFELMMWKSLYDN
jgi:GNAT superfamily N-acetyltransferase